MIIKMEQVRQVFLTAFTFLLVMLSTNAQEVTDTTQAAGDWVVPSSGDAPLEMLTPPPSFEVSTAFNGYISLKTSSAIIMIEIHDANYISIVDGITDEYLESNQLEFVSRQDFETTYGFGGVNFKLKFIVDDTEFVRYMTFIGDLNTTLWLNTTYPKMLESLVEEEILKSIHSVNLYPKGDE
jgi:hypothetical protein